MGITKSILSFFPLHSSGLDVPHSISQERAREREVQIAFCLDHWKLQVHMKYLPLYYYPHTQTKQNRKQLKTYRRLNIFGFHGVDQLCLKKTELNKKLR
jgi:hypothetical protein